MRWGWYKVPWTSVLERGREEEEKANLQWMQPSHGLCVVILSVQLFSHHNIYSRSFLFLAWCSHGAHRLKRCSKWESQLLGRLIRSPGEAEERGVWSFQGGGKDKHLFFSTFLSLSYLRHLFCFVLFLSLGPELMITQLSDSLQPHGL